MFVMFGQGQEWGEHPDQAFQDILLVILCYSKPGELCDWAASLEGDGFAMRTRCLVLGQAKPFAASAEGSPATPATR